MCCQLTESSPEEVSKEITGLTLFATNEPNREMKHFIVATLSRRALQFNTAAVANFKFRLMKRRCIKFQSSSDVELIVCILHL
jgi:hypothetical protein